MIFDGMRFTKSRKVVTLPREMYEGDLKQYIMFGRIVPEGKTSPPTAVETKWRWNYNDELIWAVPVKVNYHSLTNLMLGKDGYWYLKKSGIIYVCKQKKRKQS
jgi:hypothetical protein